MEIKIFRDQYGVVWVPRLLLSNSKMQLVLEWIIRFRNSNCILFYFNEFYVDSSAFHKILSKQGIKFRLGTKYTSAEKKKDGSGYILSLESKKDGSKDKVIY
jgi:hypothetical protein